jgi:hypothetical protein
MAELSDSITTENAYILHFLTCLIELKELIKSRKIDELSAKRKGFEVYMEDQRLLNLLGQLCEKEDVLLMDIYVSYY